MQDDPRDQQLMQLAIEEARACAAHDDVPIGCVITRGDGVIARCGNERELRQDPTAHAEVVALREAALATGSWHLEGCTLYVTLEPCAMCAGAIVLARIDRLVFGASDPKAGFAGSLGNLVADERLNHRVEVTSGILQDECAQLLRAFFREHR